MLKHQLAYKMEELCRVTQSVKQTILKRTPVCPGELNFKGCEFRRYKEPVYGVCSKGLMPMTTLTLFIILNQCCHLIL